MSIEGESCGISKPYGSKAEKQWGHKGVGVGWSCNDRPPKSREAITTVGSTDTEGCGTARAT